MSAMAQPRRGRRAMAIRVVDQSDSTQPEVPPLESAVQPPSRTVPVRHERKRLRAVWASTERGLRCRWVADE